MTKPNEQLSNLIMEYKPQLFRMATGILKNSIDAEDALSETICKAFSNFQNLRDLKKFKPWIMKILVNEAYAIANKRKKFISLEEDIPIDNNDSAIIDSIVLWDIVQSLDDEFRDVILLFYYEDMSIKEISKILQIPVGTVFSRLNRSRQKLKNIMLKEGVSKI